VFPSHDCGRGPMLKILVTGAYGTLGRPLVRELRSRGQEVGRCDLQHQAIRRSSARTSDRTGNSNNSWRRRERSTTSIAWQYIPDATILRCTEAREDGAKPPRRPRY
jgi:nucleoside-diphosphate-sugar epimerase